MEDENKSSWRYDFEEEYGENNENVEPTAPCSRAEQEAQVKQTLRELMIGIGILSVLVLLVGNLVLRGNLKFSLGVLAGTVTAVCLSFSMYRSVLIATEFPEKEASGYMKKTALYRMVIMIVVVGAAAYFLQGYGLFGVVIGILTLKLSAFLWPVIHKYNPSVRGK